MKHKRGSLYNVAFLANVILLGWGFVVEASIIFVVAFLIWLNMMFYSYKRIEYRSVLFAFGVAFFVFLLGREFLEQYRLYEVEYVFTEDVNKHLNITLVLSLIGVWVAFHYYSKKKRVSTIINRDDIRVIRFRKWSKLIFLCVYPFSLIYSLAIAYFVAKIGYASAYTDLPAVLADSVIFSLLNKIDVMLPVAFCCYIATMPRKNSFKSILLLYVLYLLLSLFGGQRGPFVLGILLVFIFIVYMQGIFPSENWFKRKNLKLALIFLPVLASAGSFYNAYRFGELKKDYSITEGFTNFFYEQGVTSYIIKRAYMHEDKIPSDIYTLQFIHTGVLARVLGIPVYNGNTVDHATKGGSFAHALGYVVLGNSYLLGRGTGSAYIAELYYDFGYAGVLIGSMIYGFMFSLIYRAKSLFQRATIFIVLTQLLWACRSSYVGFLTLLFTPTVILIGIILYFSLKIRT